MQFVTDQFADSSITANKIAANAVAAAALQAGAKQAVLQSKLTGRYVQTADQANPNAATVDVKSALGFDVTAGVDPEGVAKGKAALIEGAGGSEFNTTSGKVGSAAKGRSSKLPVMDVNGDNVVDANGREVWAVLSCSARTTAGSYTLRFYSGEFGSGTETAYTMAQGYQFAYPQIFDFADVPTWDDQQTALVDRSAAQLAPGEISTALLADGSVTNVKIANSTIGSGKFAAGAIATADLQNGSVDAVKLKSDANTDANRAVNTDHVRDAAITGAKIASSTIGAGKFVAGAIATGDLATDAVTAGKIGARYGAQTFGGDGSITQFALTNPVLAVHYAGVHVYRNGARIKYVTATPTNLDEYRVIDVSGTTKVELGAALPTGQTLSIDYLS